MITFFRSRIAGSIFLVVSLAMLTPANGGEFDALKGQSIRGIIGGKPGAGTDLMGRAFFAALGRLLPETTIHVQTVSGGAGAAAVKELSEAKGDLITVSIFGNGPIYSELLSTEAMPYDISKLHWLGSLADNRRVLSMRKALGPPVFDTLAKLDRQPIVPSSGAGSPNNIENLLINAITGAHLKVVPGFEDAQIETMLVAGDADVRLAGSFQIAPLIESGDMVPILRISDGAYPKSMQALPKLVDVALADTPKELILLLETLNKLGRPYAAAPNTDPKVVAALRAAFEVAIVDPSYMEVVAKDGIVGGSTSGAALGDAMADLLSDPDLKSTVQTYLACGKALSDSQTAQCD